jgi:hypothetical protein
VPKGDRKEQGESGPAVIWNVDDMSTLYGAVFGIEVGREEISLLFAGRTVLRNRREETVVVSDRIILSPSTAKRLLALLGKIVARHQLPIGMDSSDLRALIEATN